jgi:hypothetical protein
MAPGSRASLTDLFSVTGDDFWSSLLVLFALGPAHAFANEFDPMAVMDEATQDGVGHRVQRVISSQRSTGSCEMMTVESRLPEGPTALAAHGS